MCARSKWPHVHGGAFWHLNFFILPITFFFFFSIFFGIALSRTVAKDGNAVVVCRCDCAWPKYETKLENISSAPEEFSLLSESDGPLGRCWRASSFHRFVLFCCCWIVMHLQSTANGWNFVLNVPPTCTIFCLSVCFFFWLFSRLDFSINEVLKRTANDCVEIIIIRAFINAILIGIGPPSGGRRSRCGIYGNHDKVNFAINVRPAKWNK